MFKTSRTKIKSWAIPILATVLFFLSIPYMRSLQVFMVKSIGMHSNSIIIISLLVIFIFFLGYAYFVLSWRTIQNYAKFLFIMFMYTSAIWLFKSPTAKVRIIEVIHFLEYGGLSLLYYNALKPQDNSPVTLKNYLLPAMIMNIIGVMDESIQWFVALRTGEIRDITVNIVAGGLPQLSLFLFNPVKKSIFKLPRNDLKLLVDTLIIFCAFISVFYSKAHLGYTVTVPGKFEFVSHFTKKQLSNMATNPSMVIKIKEYFESGNYWKPENYYVSEAIGHVGVRNNCLGKKINRPDLADYENEILESFYKPVMEAKPEYKWSKTQPKKYRNTVQQTGRKFYKSPIGRTILRTGINKLHYWGITGTIIIILLSTRICLSHSKRLESSSFST